MDVDLSNCYYRNKSFDPQVGRFMQKDPIGLSAGDTNLYRYVANNPLNFVDPDGNFALGIELEAIGFLFQGGSATGTAVASVDLNPFSSTFLKAEVEIITTSSKKLGIGGAATAGANVFVAVANSDIKDLSGFSFGGSAGLGAAGGSLQCFRYSSHS